MRKPKLGQVFLIDKNIIRKIIQNVDLTKVDDVLEIGCGDGILTQALHPLVNQLTVVEIDKKCLDRKKRHA